MGSAVKIFHNANLLSFHEGFTPGMADTLVVKDGVIAAIGAYKEALPIAGDNAQAIDLQGKTLMPGLHDSHIHVWKVGNLKAFMLDVRFASSLDEMLSLLEEYHRQHPEMDWIIARGFNEAGWKEGRMPTKDDLDKVVTNTPVYVIRTCAHIAVCNTRAMEIAGITKATPAPAGGVIYKKESGDPNGVFSETALGLITSHIPPYTRDQLKTMIKVARAEMYRYGITAATDPAVDPLLLEAYYEMHAAGELGLRLQAIPILLPDGGNDPYPLPKYFSSDGLTVNTVKFFSDGGLSGKTAALKRPYKGTAADRGVLRLRKDQYLSLCRSAQDSGLGIATHAIGDAAIEFVVDIYKELRSSFPDSLLRIEHLGLPEERHLREMAACDIATSMQTIFLRELGRNFIKYLDAEYLDRCYPVRSVLDHGILTALSSDAPVVRDLNPFSGMASAITRQDSEGYLIASGEAIRVEETLKAYTLSAARISRLPQLGSLESGKLADLIILDRDPLRVPPDELTSVKVEATYVGGDCVFSRIRPTGLSTTGSNSST